MLRAPLIMLAVALAARTASAQATSEDFGIPKVRPAVVSDAGPVARPFGDLFQTGWCDDGGCLDGSAESVLCENCDDFGGGNGPIKLRFGVPAWLPEYHGTTTVRGVQAPVNVTTRELFKSIDDVNFIVVGRAEASVGRWGLIGDGFYLSMGENRTVAGDRINVAANFRQAIADGVLRYGLIQPEDAGPGDVSADLLAGARYWLLDADRLTLTGPRGNSVTEAGTRQWVDPIVGARIAAPLTEDLLFRLRGDVGGFGAASRFTWNVEAVGEYRCSDCCGLQLGYRVLDVDYSRGDFAYDVNYRGPIATLVFDF